MDAERESARLMMISTTDDDDDEDLGIVYLYWCMLFSTNPGSSTLQNNIYMHTHAHTHTHTHIYIYIYLYIYIYIFRQNYLTG